MASTNTIDKIINNRGGQGQDFSQSLWRTEDNPIDVTEVFYKLSSAQAYAKGENDPNNRYFVGSASYVGQHVSVVDKDLSSTTMYQIRDTAGNLNRIATTDDFKVDYDEESSLFTLSVADRTLTAEIKSGKDYGKVLLSGKYTDGDSFSFYILSSGV